jgi:hypothetical protein
LIGLLVLIVVVAFVLIVVVRQHKQPQVPTSVSAPAIPVKDEKPKIEKFLGVIEKVDETARTIDVKGKVKKQEKVVVFPTDDQIRITRAGMDMSLAELKKGMAVSVEYRKDGDKVVAVAVKVSAPKAGPKKEQPHAEDQPVSRLKESPQGVRS